MESGLTGAVIGAGITAVLGIILQVMRERKADARALQLVAYQAAMKEWELLDEKKRAAPRSMECALAKHLLWAGFFADTISGKGRGVRNDRVNQFRELVTISDSIPVIFEAVAKDKK